MFPTSFYAGRFYAPRYFPKVGADRVVSGQIPQPSRYRFSYQLTDVVRMLMLWL